MSPDKLQMFPCPLFHVHFRNNDFTVLLSHSILTADEGEDCGMTVDIHKEGEAANAFRNYTRSQFLAITIPLQLPHSESVLQLVTLPLQFPHSESVLQLSFLYSSHIKRVSCSYHSPAAPILRDCLAVTIPLTATTLRECLEVTIPLTAPTFR